MTRHRRKTAWIVGVAIFGTAVGTVLSWTILYALGVEPRPVPSVIAALIAVVANIALGFWFLRRDDLS